MKQELGEAIPERLSLEVRFVILLSVMENSFELIKMVLNNES